MVRAASVIVQLDSRGMDGAANSEYTVHGLKIVQVEGHHITNIPKKAKRKK